MASQDSTTNDELLEYLSDRMFQIPVKSFMDENCLIFDPSIEVSPDHLAVFATYQKLVKDLLEDFCQSKRVSFRQIHDSVMKLYREPDLREFFGASFEQVLSSGDFDIFSQAMIAHNIVIQEQVLRMILASTGFIPDSLLTTRTSQSDDEKERQAQDARSKPPSQSKFARDEFSEKKKKTGGENDFESKREKEIEAQRKLLEEEMRLLALVSASTVKVAESSLPVQPTAKSTGKSTTAESKPSSTEVRNQAIASPSSRKSPSSQMSSAEAAQKWMKEAHQERANHPEDIHSTTDSKWSHNPSDMTQRQQFLREQRDKILAMRREAREKQLSIDDEPKMTSRDAIKNQKPVTSPASSDHEKMLAKRRALAAKLRQEVVDK